MTGHIIGSISGVIILLFNSFIIFLLSKKFKLFNLNIFNYACFFILFYFILAQLIFYLLIFKLNINLIKNIILIIYFIFISYIFFNYKNIKLFVNKIFFYLKSIYWLDFFILLGCFFLVLSPITDSDSLDYHLGGPINIIKENYLLVRNDEWYHFRLISTGEMINLIGLFFASKNWGQIFQFFCLINIYFIFKHILSVQHKLTNLIIFSSPILVSLLLSAKHLFFCSISYLLVFYFFLYDEKLHKKAEMTPLIFLLIFIPISFKYSYMIYSFPFCVYYIYLCKKNFNYKYLLFSLLTLIFLLSPLFLKNILHYGDPISPFLEFIKNNPNQKLIDFQNELRFSEKVFSLKEFLFIPFYHSFSFSFSTMTLLISPISLISYYIFFSDTKKSIKILFLVIYILLFISGKSQSRYFYDFYILLLFIISINYLKKKNNLFLILNNKIIKFYLAITTCFIVYGCIFLSLTSYMGAKNYFFVMNTSAFNHDVILWLNKNIKKNEMVFHDFSLRSKTFQEYNFVFFDMEFLNNNQIVDVIKKYDVNKLVISKKNLKKIDEILYCDKDNFDSFKTTHATRNPFNKVINADIVYIVKSDCLKPLN